MKQVHCLKMQILNEEARPLYEDHGHFHPGDGGLDLFCLEDMIIPAGQTAMIKFGIACEVVDNTCNYFLMPRSSFSKVALEMCNSIGLIDMDYRGEIMAPVRNTNQIVILDEDGKTPIANPDGDVCIEKGTRLFQLVEGPKQGWRFDIVPKLSETKRGAGGFGSTGK